MSIASAFVKGSSSQMDLQCMTILLHKLFLELRMSCYIEWVPSNLNSADTPSRDPDKFPSLEVFPE
eukprot:12424826-Karenia_brevis.AAC.1